MLPRDRAASRRARTAAWPLMVAAMLAMPSPSPLNGAPAAPDPGLQIQLTAHGERDRARIESAAREALAQLRAWLGPCRCPSLTITDRLPGGSADTAGLIPIAPHDWEAPRTMEVESHVVFGIARLWFAGVHDEGAGVSVADSLAWYLQSRVVERLFDHPNRAMHSDEAVRYFGGFVPRVFESLPLSRWSGGLGRSEFLRDPSDVRSALQEARRLPPGMDRGALRGALAVATLERHLSWPMLQVALRAVAARSAVAPLGRAEFGQVFSAAVGQDLSWFLKPAFDPRVRFAYGISAFSTAPGNASCGAPACFATRITVVRTGDGQFTGTARPTLGDGESGDAMALRVMFADGQSATARWDGRAAERVFEFASPAPAWSAEVDPDGVLRLDMTPLDHVRRLVPTSNVSVAKWVLRWVSWLEDAMLTAAFVVA